MLCFVIQVKTDGETAYINRAQRFLDSSQNELIFLQRQLFIRKQRARKGQTSPLFSGYVFLVTQEESLSADTHTLLRKTDGFIRFLKSTTEPTPLVGRDLALIRHFMSFGPTINSSKAYFDENDRIVITEGPLKGLEGNIKKVDRRKGRAKIKLDMYDEQFLIDLAFETIQKESRTEAATT